MLILIWRHTATKLVDVLHNTPEGCGFDPKWGPWDNKFEEVPSERRRDIAEKVKFCISTLKYLQYANVYTLYVANVCAFLHTKFQVLT